VAEPEHQDYLENFSNGYTCHFGLNGSFRAEPSRAERSQLERPRCNVTELEPKALPLAKVSMCLRKLPELCPDGRRYGVDQFGKHYSSGGK